MKGSYHRRKANNKKDVIRVPNDLRLNIDYQTLVNALQAAYECGYNQTENGMMLTFGHGMAQRIIANNEESE